MEPCSGSLSDDFTIPIGFPSLLRSRRWRSDVSVSKQTSSPLYPIYPPIDENLKDKWISQCPQDAKVCVLEFLKQLEDSRLILFPSARCYPFDDSPDFILGRYCTGDLLFFDQELRHGGVQRWITQRSTIGISRPTRTGPGLPRGSGSRGSGTNAVQSLVRRSCGSGTLGFGLRGFGVIEL
jgi:hypothetical protein